MNKVVEKEAKIENLIYVIRGKEVMLDADLARLYQCTNGTKDINRAVKRNINRFPSDFYFQLTESEINELDLRFQFGTLNSKGNYRGQHLKYLPYVFTEQGVAMLASVLHTEVAEEVSVRIMRTFVKMRHYIKFNNDILPNKVLLLERQVDDNTKRINELFDKFDPKEILNGCIYFENQLYDAYSILMDIFNSSKKTVIIIDNYAGKELLDMLREVDKSITIISKNIDTKLIKKYEKQYKNVTFINDDSFHDRIIIIDFEKVYMCGTSLKDFGKYFSVLTLLDDRGEIRNIILDKITKYQEKKQN
ncbi:MAG: ORF6N domain-containing protein [Bacilli bacterium]|nr:ORF6N domain-containing protein [Bacilli bacterium]